MAQGKSSGSGSGRGRSKGCKTCVGISRRASTLPALTLSSSWHCLRVQRFAAAEMLMTRRAIATPIAGHAHSHSHSLRRFALSRDTQLFELRSTVPAVPVGPQTVRCCCPCYCCWSLNCGEGLQQLLPPPQYPFSPARSLAPSPSHTTPTFPVFFFAVYFVLCCILLLRRLINLLKFMRYSKIIRNATSFTFNY